MPKGNCDDTPDKQNERKTSKDVDALGKGTNWGKKGPETGQTKRK